MISVQTRPLPAFRGEKTASPATVVRRDDWNYGFQENRPIYPYSFHEAVRDCAIRYHDPACRYGVIAVIPEGEVRYRSGERGFSVCGDRVLVIPPGTDFQFETTKVPFYRKITLQVLGVNLSGILDTLGFSGMELVAVPDAAAVIAEMRQIGDLIAAGDVAAMPEMAGRTLALLSRLAARRQESGGDSLLFRLAKDRLASDLGQPLSVSELAGELKSSTSTLERLFRKHLRMTPREFRIRCRVAAARELLRNSDASVKEIAFRLGYCHQFHFANEFTRLAGMSPAGFRRSSRTEMP